ncbi:MAG TPA: hypothetical protein VNM14_26415 [Planctomycetota bacterium]|nr:hypothetical protein [Planctomycetota bacterium]
MLFSDARVSAFVREQFVAAWESVRPVPLVEIDFGNGHTIKRTVNGNIATYVCAPDGRVVDVIPGLNSPEAYLQDLKYALNLYRASLAAFDKTILEYHKDNLTAPTVYEYVRNDYSKAMIERLMKMSIDKRQEIAERKGLGVRIVPAPYDRAALKDVAKTEVEGAVRTPEEVALLAADTEINRKERKPILHQILSEKIYRPAELTKRVYKEALHCDLDDPYLGLISSAFNGGAYENR